MLNNDHVNVVKLFGVDREYKYNLIIDILYNQCVATDYSYSLRTERFIL